MSREIELLEKQLAFWKHHAASLTKALDEAEQTANLYSQLLDKTEEELNAERVQREDVTDINVAGKSEWISVSERLPSEEEQRDEYGELVPFLVCEKDTTYPYRAFYDGTEWGDGLMKIRGITHWMPLPEAPGMKGGE